MNTTQISLWTPTRYFAAVLAIIFIGEVEVRYLLPFFLAENVDHNLEAFCDAGLLTLISAPILWVVLIQPLRAAASDESRKYMAIVEQSRDGILTLNPDGLIDSYNATVVTYFGARVNELIGKPITDLFPALGRGESLAESLNARVRELEARYSEEETDWVCEQTFEVCVSGLTIRGIQQFTLLIRDTTERKKIQKNLAEVNQQLVEVAHRAGKAEVATCVIHNVGNVLTNVNVLASAVTSKIENSRMSGLAKGAELIQNHTNDLATFLTEDRRGKQLPAYFVELSRCWERETKDVLDDLRSLSESLQHANKIVDAQQDFASAGSVTESTSLVNLLNKGLAISLASMERHAIQLDTEFEELPAVMIDRHKLLQVLVNLLTNAKEAFNGQPESAKKDKIITLRLYSYSRDRFRVNVSDNGVGIDSNDLTRIFANGFTTKNDGHGFGLHYSALAVKEMGGVLSVHSDGLGCGATFTIDLPLQLDVLVSAS